MNALEKTGNLLVGGIGFPGIPNDPESFGPGIPRSLYNGFVIHRFEKNNDRCYSIQYREFALERGLRLGSVEVL